MEELGSSQSNGPGTESVGQTAWRPYVPTGVRSYDDDDRIPTAKCSLVIVSSPGGKGGGGWYSPIYGF